MNAPAQFMSSTALTPAQYERSKTRQQKAEDIAYTINHALSCGLTDVFIQGPISDQVSKWSARDNWLGRFCRWADQFFEKHDHAHNHTHNEPSRPDPMPVTVEASKKTPWWRRTQYWVVDLFKGSPAMKDVLGPRDHTSKPRASKLRTINPHIEPDPPHVHEAPKIPKKEPNTNYSIGGHIHGPGCGHVSGAGGYRAGSGGNVAHPHQHGLRDWMVGEAFGDFAAVPLTIGVQRLFPGFMHGIRRVLEPITGWAFRAGAERDARAWARQHSFAIDGPEATAKAHDLYEHELSHLPQAVMWNVFSIPTNLMVQKHLMKSSYSWPQLLVGKTFGSMVSNGMLIGARAISPDTMHGIDRWNSKHIIVPTAKKIGKALGYDTQTMEDAANSVHNRRAAPSREWVERVQRDATPDKAIG